jgi:uncharacterized protein (UPF0332 family)
MTKEQSALLKKATDSLRAARLLADDGLTDFAVSRSYYTIFYLAEAILLSKGLSFSKHSAVISAFGREFVKTGIIPAKYHTFLIEGQDARNIGDYDIEDGITDIKTQQQISRAELFLEFTIQFINEKSGEN